MRIDERSHRASLIWLLVFVVALQVGYPVTHYGRAWTLAYGLGYMGTVFFGVAIASGHRRSRTAIVSVGISLIVILCWFALRPPTDDVALLRPIVLTLFQVLLLIQLGRYLFGGGPSDDRIDVLLVSFSTYLLLGAAFAGVYNIIEVAAPGSFIDHANAGPVGWQTLLYGSYASMTTLGFGDVVAISPWGRSLMTFEAIVGPLFVATVIAQLIGTQTTPADTVHDMIDSP